MSNVTLRGSCPAPFYDVSLFPKTGGFIDGRFCEPFAADLACCLPCPSTQWIYPNSFDTVNVASGWLNVVGLILNVLLLVTYAVLPLEYTRSHYLSISLIVAVIFVNLGFVIPLAAQPEKCYNEITPNDMYSSTTCAFSGAFILAGAICAVSWILIRSFSMHLQIVWDIVPDKRFFYWAQAFGWAMPAVIFTAVMSATGVSFRFGDACHVNHNHAMADFWVWLLMFSAAAIVLQLITVGYCIHVYVRNFYSDSGVEQSTQRSGEGLPPHPNSVRTQTARAIYHRLKRVLWMQWRGMLIVTNMLVDVILFAVVFVYLDDYSSTNESNFDRARPWLACLVESGGDKKACLSLGQEWLVSEATVAAVLILLSMASMQIASILFRFSMVTGWIEHFRTRFSHKQEFVSLDAMPASERPWTARSQERNANGTMFEMQRPQKDHGIDIDTKSVSPTMTDTSSPSMRTCQTSKPQFYPPQIYPIQEHQSQGYTQYDRTDANRTTHQSSSSAQAEDMGWDPTSTYAHGGARA